MSEAIRRFFWAPASPLPLVVLRITLAATLLAQAGSVAGNLFELYGSSGVVQESLTRYIADPSFPRISWFAPALAKIGVSESQVILGVAGGYVVSLVLLLLGRFTRGAAVGAWFLHWVLMNSGPCTNYGADNFAHIFLFYLMWMPCTDREPSEWARLGLRVIQIHLCMVYLSAGIEKAMCVQWWDGDVMWRALMLPDFRRFDFSWLAWVPWLTLPMAWGALLIELGYAVFIWPRRTRRLWVLLTIALHLGIAIFMNLEVFGMLMAFLTLSAFGVSAEPQPRGAPLLARLGWVGVGSPAPSPA